MTQAPILAAGGIVIRGGRKPLIAVVQRRKDNGWVLPKGKLKRSERAITAARREVLEETGHNALVQEFLGVITYLVGGRPKVVQFWKMRADGGPACDIVREIKAVAWLPLQSAINRLSHPLEQLFLRNVGRQAVKLDAPAARKRRAARKDRSARRSVRKPPPRGEAPGAGEPPIRPLPPRFWSVRNQAAGAIVPTMPW